MMDYNSNLSTKNVSHFTPTFENLKGIVENGFKPHECDELAMEKLPTEAQEILMNFYAALFGIDEEKQQEIFRPTPMVCFCDIPDKLIAPHRRNYGAYGIVLTKEWAIKHGISPVSYIPENSRLHDFFTQIDSVFQRMLDQIRINHYVLPEAMQLQEIFTNLYLYIKPYMDDKEKKKYYDEREWRYIPPAYGPGAIDPYLPFEKEDFVGAIVKTKKEKAELLKLLRTKFGNIPNKKVKVYPCAIKRRWSRKLFT